MASKEKFATTCKVFLRRILSDISALVRGQMFFSLISLALFLIIPAAQATLLKGYVTVGKQTDSAPVPGQTQPTDRAAADSQPAAAAETPTSAPDQIAGPQPDDNQATLESPSEA